jgi:hypothetical protein
MFEDGHTDVPLSDWEIFRKEFPPLLIEEVLDRKDVRTPDWEVPLARGYAIAGRHLLQSAADQSGTTASRGWQQGKMYFAREAGPNKLFVVQYYNRDLWAISRRLPEQATFEATETLVFAFGSTPMLTRCYQSAMNLADLCCDSPPPGLHWIKTCPDHRFDGVKFARKRRATEARALRDARSERRRARRHALDHDALARSHSRPKPIKRASMPRAPSGSTAR